MSENVSKEIVRNSLQNGNTAVTHHLHAGEIVAFHPADYMAQEKVQETFQLPGARLLGHLMLGSTTKGSRLFLLDTKLTHVDAPNLIIVDSAFKGNSPDRYNHMMPVPVNGNLTVGREQGPEPLADGLADTVSRDHVRITDHLAHDNLVIVEDLNAINPTVLSYAQMPFIPRR